MKNGMQEYQQKNSIHALTELLNVHGIYYYIWTIQCNKLGPVAMYSMLIWNLYV